MLTNVGFAGLVGMESENGDGGVGRTRGFGGLVEQPEHTILQAAGGVTEAMAAEEQLH